MTCLGRRVLHCHSRPGCTSGRAELCHSRLPRVILGGLAQATPPLESPQPGARLRERQILGSAVREALTRPSLSPRALSCLTSMTLTQRAAWPVLSEPSWTALFYKSRDATIINPAQRRGAAGPRLHSFGGKGLMRTGAQLCGPPEPALPPVLTLWGTLCTGSVTALGSWGCHRGDGHPAGRHQSGWGRGQAPEPDSHPGSPPGHKTQRLWTSCLSVANKAEAMTLRPPPGGRDIPGAWWATCYPGLW